ncbi:hypothetical protein C5745_05660 [Sphingobacterium haloxyli]|uniref:AsmA-like C-terminal domain-containing protein n=1 Tax=Sphingobacterium haloxyli TaxID=2100533 RepID=A0A2S9J7G7_9SPHI|nr:hypothetical protein C5745_05660 [Sphingobacterium haloxyli]
MTALVVGSYYIGNWKPKIKGKLEEMVRQKSQGLYTLVYEDMELRALTGTVRLRNVELVPDSIVYNDQVATKIAPDDRFHVRLASLEVEGVSLWSALIRKELSIRYVTLNDAEVRILSEPHAYNDTVKYNRDTALYDRINDVFKSIQIDKVSVEHLNIVYSKTENGSTNEIKADSMRFRFYDILIDENAAKDSMRVYYCKALQVDIPKFEYDIPNSPYKVGFDHLEMDSRNNELMLAKLGLSPKIRKVDYFRDDKQNKALIFLNFDTVKLEKIRLRDLIDRERISAAYVHVRGGTASFHKDKRFQQDNVNKIGEAPHQKIMGVNQLLYFDTILVDGVYLSYHELSGKYLREGVITFEKVHGNITNLTNDTSQLEKDGFMRADLRASLMGSGRLHARFGFDMLSKNGSHSYAGTLGSMEVSAFNRIITPLLNLQFASGNVRRIRFDMQGNDYRNWGKLYFDYDQLKVNLLYPPGAESNKRGKRGILTFLLNQLLINDSNPDANEVYHIGEVDYERVPEYSHFKTIWKSLQEGLQQTVGLSESSKRKLKERE